jgi:uncharacterized protein YdcH (DUF465 family)
MLQPITLLGFADGLVGIRPESCLEVPNDHRGQKWGDFLEAVIILSHLLQESARFGSLVSRQGQLDDNLAKEFGIHQGGEAMTFRPLRPPEV